MTCLLVNSDQIATINHCFSLFCRLYKLLNILEFNSSRKRMSVIVQDEEGKLLLLSKGADRFVSHPTSLSKKSN